MKEGLFPEMKKPYLAAVRKTEHAEEITAAAEVLIPVAAAEMYIRKK